MVNQSVVDTAISAKVAGAISVPSWFSEAVGAQKLHADISKSLNVGSIVGPILPKTLWSEAMPSPIVSKFFTDQMGVGKSLKDLVGPLESGSTIGDIFKSALGHERLLADFAQATSLSGVLREFTDSVGSIPVLGGVTPWQPKLGRSAVSDAIDAVVSFRVTPQLSPLPPVSDWYAIPLITRGRPDFSASAIPADNQGSWLESVRLGLSKKRAGMWFAFHYSPDGLSQAANSAVELINAVLASIMTFDAVRGWAVGSSFVDEALRADDVGRTAPTWEGRLRFAAISLGIEESLHDAVVAKASVMRELQQLKHGARTSSRERARHLLEEVDVLLKLIRR